MQKLKQNDIVLLELPVRKIENLRTKNQGNGGNLLHNIRRAKEVNNRLVHTQLKSVPCIGTCKLQTNIKATETTNVETPYFNYRDCSYGPPSTTNYNSLNS